jgi:hypothetical protein
MNKLENFISESKTDLLNKLSEINIRVPQRTKGRKTEHTEIWSICRLLSTYANENLFSFPIEIIHRDKPDFLVIIDTIKIGIEFTEAISEQYARALALRENIQNAVIEPSLFGWSAPKRNKDEIIEIINQSSRRLIGLPKTGDSVEIEWVNGIWDCIVSKLIKLNKNYDKFNKNWLLIYDNLPTVALDLSIAIEYLNTRMKSYWDNSLEYHYLFDAVIIESDGNLVVITSKDNLIYQIYDLWKRE